MNKSQLVDALADRLGDRRTAATAVDALLQIVVDTVRSGGAVSLTGFGVFESRARAARTGRNPRTGQTVEVPATTVPAFRPGTGFRAAVAGDDPAPATAAPATNGAGVTGEALHGAVELGDPAALRTDAPAQGGAKGRKKARAVAPVEVAEPDDAGVPEEPKPAKAAKGAKAAKDAEGAKAKKDKHGKKHKK